MEWDVITGCDGGWTRPGKVPPMVVLTLAVACTGGLDDTGQALAPWDDQVPVALEALRPLLVAPLDGAVVATRLALLSERPHAFVLDADAGKVHVFDERYRHQADVWCLDPSPWPDFPPEEVHRGVCDEGQVELSRSGLEPPGVVHGLATQGGNALVWSAERLHRASADLLAGSPWDLLRLDEGMALEVPEPASSGVLVAGAGQETWFASDRWLGQVSGEGELLASWVLPDLVRDLAWSAGQVWVATDSGLWSPELDQINGSDLRRLAADGDGGVWGVDLETELALHVAASGVTTAVEVPGATGPLAADLLTGRVALGVDTGLVLFEDGEEVGRFDGIEVRDLGINAHHEVVALTPDGLAVFGDELALGHGEPLALVVGAFIEQPRSPAQDLPCRGEHDSISGHLATAARNRGLLEDLPATVALGVTPQMARRALACGQVHDLYRAADGDRVELGVLNHELPEDPCIEDPDCHAAFLADQHADVESIGLDAEWFSGLLVHEDRGVDWVASLVSTGLTDTYLHFGLSVLPELDHGADPRAKQPYPPIVSGGATPLVGSTLEDLFESEGGGALRLLPGNAMSAFRLSRCPNLMLWECNTLAGTEAEPVLRLEDIEVLQVLLFRALGAREGPGSAWTFHLPDLGAWDYTSDCAVTDRRWSGEDCQGARLQDWLLDVDARYVDAGLVSWTRPAEVPWPR